MITSDYLQKGTQVMFDSVWFSDLFIFSSRINVDLGRRLNVKNGHTHVIRFCSVKMLVTFAAPGLV